MSRCDISVKFEQTNRKYRGGDTVSGEVYIQINKDTTSEVHPAEELPDQQDPGEDPLSRSYDIRQWEGQVDADRDGPGESPCPGIGQPVEHR